VCAARRADPLLARRALAVLAWGFAALGLMLIVEAATGGAIYRAIHIAFYEPIRPDLARKNVAQSTFVLALLWPLAALGVTGRLRPALAAPMVLGVAVAGVRFGADAPVISLLLGALAALCVWRCPRRGPKAFAGLAAAIFLLMPLIVWSVREFADYSAIEHLIPLSWAERMGYWSHAVDWIWDQPLRGWGLDASRMFAPAIQLHPHDSALQVWLELGAVGGLLAAAFWGVTLPRLARPGPDLVAAATAACCAAYLLFGGVNFGVWQEWWLALGSLVAVLSALNGRTAPAAELSTSAPISE
jgi:O-antigen ligase